MTQDDGGSVFRGNVWDNAKEFTETDYYELVPIVQNTIGENTMPTLVEIFMEKGIKQGLEKGMEKGAIEREAKAIIRTLTKRFKTVPAPLEEQVRAIADLERLEKLADFAYDCESLEEFGKALV